MTLAIPSQRVKLYRALWDRWIIVLRILLDLGAGAHPVRWQAVADTLLVDKKTCQKYIAGLVRDGHLALAGTGHMLTEAGMAFLRETNGGEIPNYLESGKNPGETFSPLKESVEVGDPELKPLTTSPTESGKNPGETFSPDVRLALEHLPLLFAGSEITHRGLPEFLHIEKVLGWIAYAFDKRTSLHSPVGLIYSKLTDASEPSPYIKYMERPDHYLPEEYLDAIGRWERACGRCGVAFTRREAYEAHQTVCVFTPEPVLSDEQLHPIPEHILDIWEEIRDLVRQTHDKGPFRACITSLFRLSHFEHDILFLNVILKKYLAQDDMRMEIQTLLRQHGCDIDVQFVVAVETERADVP